MLICKRCVYLFNRTAFILKTPCIFVDNNRILKNAHGSRSFIKANKLAVGFKEI